MDIITTIYFAELEPTSKQFATESIEETASAEDAGREWISIYVGKNRVLPIDWNGW
jgi:hypothetical protein